MRGGAVLDGVGREAIVEGFSEEVTFEQRPKMKDYTGTGERSTLDEHLWAEQSEASDEGRLVEMRTERLPGPGSRRASPAAAKTLGFIFCDRMLLKCLKLSSDLI